MFDNPIFTSPMFQYVVIPLLIFCARVCDVSIGTVRLILLYRGRRILAPILGFFEVLIWLLAIRQIMANLSNPFVYIAFAGGFAMGNYVGIILEEKLAVGLEIIRIITKTEALELINSLTAEGYGTTSVDAHGSTGKVQIIFTIVPRRHHLRVIKIIKKFNPRAFYTVEDVKSASEGIFPLRSSMIRKSY
ncbi:MAG: DUF2179 domain-containing protein [Candidatus Omnitrophica bacterium]|nr:DUF2179 domain-containing protein [Candidatus Omnitrophota bacterium]